MARREDSERLAGYDDYLDGGQTVDRPPSTVRDVTQIPAKMLREGKITRSQLEAFLAIGE